MPDIAVTPDQRERLCWIQRRLEEDIAYGHVRPCDALDYLLDHAEATDALAELDAENATASTGSGDENEHTSPATSEGVDTDAPDLDSDATADPSAEPVAETQDDDPSDSGDSETGGSASEVSASDSANGETTLNSMMRLLETHDDKWREASVGDEKYEVDLPDGSTEPARTRDDVRALLFKHYR